MTYRSNEGGQTNAETKSHGRAGRCGAGVAGRGAGKLRRRRQRRAHRAGGGHQCSADRGLAPLCRSSQCRRRRQRQEDPVDRARRSGRAVEGRRQCQAPPEPGQCAPAGAVEPVVDLRTGHCRDQARQRAAHADGRGLPERGLSARRSAAVLHHRLCRRLRQPRHARLRQGDGEGAGAHRFRRHGDPALARRNRLCRGTGEDHGHDRGRQGSDSAADRGLHAVRHQAQGRQPKLDIFLGAMGDTR